jgi:microcystin-dependent protein
LLSIAQNAALFSVIGTTYGGNGSTNFALPNLCSRVPLGMSSSKTYNGLSPNLLGQSGGAEMVTLLTSNLPSHTHVATLQASPNASDSSTPGQNYLSNPTDQNASGDPYQSYVTHGNAGTLGALAGLTVAPIGGNLPFAVLPPYQVISYIIAIAGQFPVRP